MSDANNMRKYLQVLNERAPDAPYQGKHDANPNVNYSTEQKGEDIHKVIAHLTADPSGRYTKLGRNLIRMERIKARMDTLKEEVKGETRELIADLFNADDACRTREVDTVSFIFQMTKDPKETVAPKYKDILEKLTEHMTPELIAMKEKLLKEMVTRTQKAPAIKIARDKAEEGLEEGLGDTLKSIQLACRKFFSSVLNWGKDYDARLDALKAEVTMGESAVKAAPSGFSGLDKDRGAADIHWGNMLSKGFDALTRKKEKKSYDQAQQRVKNKKYRNELRSEGIEESNPLSEEPTEDPRATGAPILYRGYEIGYDSEAALWTGEGYYYNVEGWEPGDPDGETGQHDSAGRNTVGSVEEAKEMIDDELDGEPIVQEDDYASDWGEVQKIEGAMDLEDGVLFGAKLLGIQLEPFFPGDDMSSQQAKQLVGELAPYAHKVTVQQHDEGHVTFHCGDEGSVNISYGPLATAWVDENGHFYYEA